jgi:hypothetical protein
MSSPVNLPFGTVEFSTGSSPSLPIGTYSIELTHTIQGPGGPIQIQGPAQTISVQGPQFTLNPQFVASCYPPNAGADQYEQQLPFIAFADPDLPWDIDLGVAANGSPPPPWMALVIFAEGEIAINPTTGSPLTTCTVADYINGTVTPGTNTLLPDLDPAAMPLGGVASMQCQVITILPEIFGTILPTVDDLQYLAHRRSMNVAGEPQQTVSALLCNRFPLYSAAASSPARGGLKYYAHVVSLQGFASLLGTTPSQYAQVQLLSLYNWSFLTMPETGANFETVVTGLVGSQAATAGGGLALPVSGSPAGVSPEVVKRLDSGYAALDFHAFDTSTFAWYRGPFSPVPPAAPPLSVVENATSSDALLVYVANDGLFDTSYAAAWNLGRSLAISDGSYTSALLAYRQGAAASLAMLAKRMAMPHLAGKSPRRLLRRRVARQALVELANEGLGRAWNAALASAREAFHPRSMNRLRSTPRREDPRALLADPEVTDAILESIEDLIPGIARFLGSLCLLEGVPFSTLVPDPRMLPLESIRFFYVDDAWVAALISGAVSLAIHTTLDAGIHVALWPRLRERIEEARRARFARFAAVGTPQGSPGWAASGVLIRSQLVSSFPSVNITASAGSTPLDVIRDTTLGTSVRLTLFDGIPDFVTLAEPYHGLRFGANDDNAIQLRVATGSSNQLGLPTTGSVPLSSFMASSGVVDVSGLAAEIGSQAGLTLDPGDFALQMVQPPQSQLFAAGGNG